jgi:putative membrane protein
MFPPIPLGAQSPGPVQELAVPAAVLLWWAPYHLRARTLARQGRPVARWRMASFAAGLLLLLASLSPPVDELSGRLFTAHMAQHLAIADLAALLLVLGLTGPLVAPLLRIRALDRLRVVAHPVAALLLWGVNLYAWHLPALYQGALRHDGVHALEHVAFLVLGANLWMPLFGPLPKPPWFGNYARLGYVLAVRFAGAVLANVFLWSDRLFYPFYVPGTARYDLSPLSDQSVAGAVMMVEQSVVLVGLLGWLCLQWIADAGKRQALAELAAERGVALDEQRIARAVASGHGDELRRRLLTSAR